MYAAVLLLALVVLMQSTPGTGRGIASPSQRHMYDDQTSLLDSVQNVKRRQLSEDDTFQRYLGFGANSIFSPRFGFNGDR
ncbi:hypothetical protein GCK32_021847 [Trichostrongylus colubriformis]|uniref:Uncharacterized protein n=1 Tax=Trichostrongylus colubriformis TaxID=6319 RepID=A0AAN8IGQ2_TRICO